MARRRTRRVVLAVLLAFAVVAAVAIPIGLKIRADAATQAARSAAEGFARAWSTGSLASVRFSGAGGADAAKRVATATAGLTSAAKDRPSAVEVLSVTQPDQGASTRATAGHVDARRRPALELRDDGRPRRERRRLVGRVGTDAGPPRAHRLRAP